jgi:outer membrane autotransporter protein
MLSNDLQAKPHPLKRPLRALSVVLLASTALVGLGQAAQAQNINATGIVIDGVSGGPYGSDFYTSSTSVGFTAPGELTISNGGTMRGPAASYTAHVGNRGAGTATITGAGSRWYDMRMLRVGWSETGTLNILDGGEASTRDALVGGWYNGKGEVNVTNPGSRLLVSNLLSLGDDRNARGVLNITDGGFVSSTFASVGRSTQQDNRVNISGASSNWTVTSGAMQVGGAGWGSLTLTEGGTLTSASRVDLAFRDTARGTINFGAAAGDPALAPGYLTSDEIRFGEGDGVIVFNHTDGGFALASDITGSGSLEVRAGTTILSGVNSFSGETRMMGGTLRAGGAGALSSGARYSFTGGVLDLDGHNASASELTGANGSITLGGASFTLNQSTATSFGGAITGAGQLHFAGSGSLTLSGANSFGTARVTNGVLRAGAADAFTQNADYIIDGGVLDLNGFNLSMGSLSGTGGRLALVAADVTLNPVGDESFAGAITGSGAVIFKGPGSLTLTGANSYTGGTVVEGGVLRAGSLRAFVNDTVYTVNGGVLDLNGFNLYMAELSGTGGTVDLGTAGLTITQDTTTEFGGAFRGSGFLVLDGPGGMSLTGATTDFTGDMLIQGGSLDILNAFSGTNATIGGRPDEPGVVRVSGADANWTLDGFLDIGSNGSGALTLSDGGVVTVAGPVRISNGGVINFGAGEGETARAVGMLTAESVSFGAGGGQLVFNHTDQDFTYAASTSGNARMTVYAGTTTLTGANSYTGGTLVEGGVLRAGAKGAFVQDGVYTINGGVLDLGGFSLSMSELSGAGGVVDLGSAGLTITQETSTEFGGAFTGSGFLVLNGSGRMALTGASTDFTGGVLVQNGALDIRNAFTSSSAYIIGSTDEAGQVNVSGSDALWQVDGFLELGTLGPGGLMVSEGGRVSVSGPIVLADGGVIAIGAAKGQDAAAAGFIDTSAVSFGADGARLVFNHTHDAYTFDADITGLGGVEILSGTTILTGANAYTGRTWVEGGELIVNSTIGAVEVGAGGRLGGRGQIGDAVVEGVIAPGNSIGALSVNGDLTLASGSVYEVEVGGQGFTPGVNNDLLTVSGAVTIDEGATLAILGQGERSDFDLVNTYTVLTAGSGVTGGFSTVTDPFAFMDSYLVYEGGDVRVVLQRNDIAFADAAVTGNQRAAAQGLDSLPANSAIRRAILGLYESEAPEVFDALSGEIHASVQTALAGEAEHVQRGLFSRLEGPREGRAVWAQVLGAWGEADGQQGVQDIETSSAGVLFGVDHQWSDLTLGLAGGYIRSSHDRQNFDATVDADSYYLGVYAGRDVGALSVRVNGAYGHHALSSDRRLSLAGQSEHLTANYDASSVQAAAEASWRLETAPSDIEPFARLSYVHLDADRVSETGGMVALNGQADAVEALTSTLGLRAGDVIELAGIRAYLTGQLGWRHAYGDLTSEAVMAFEGGEAFGITGVAQSRDAAEIGARAVFDLSDRSDVSVGYTGELGDSAEQHSLTVRLRLGF